VPHQTATLQVSLERTEPAKLPVALPSPPVLPNPPKTAPPPQTQAGAHTAPPPLAQPQPSNIPHLDLPQLADTTYYEALALDVQPQVVSPIVLTDPEAESPDPHVGHVRLQLRLEADGRVSEAKVLESKLPRAYEVLALEVFGDAKFTPGRKDGRAVRARIVIEVDFKPRQLNSR
jgi:protein TonB